MRDTDLGQVQLNVLKKVHRALGTGGRLIVTQPYPSPAKVQIVVDGRTVMQDTLREPNYRKIIVSARKAIARVVDAGLYREELHLIKPPEDDHPLHMSFDSIDEWLDAYWKYSVDRSVRTDFAARAKRCVRSQRYSVVEFYRQEVTILMKA